MNRTTTHVVAKFLGLILLLGAGPVAADDWSKWEPTLARHSLNALEGDALRIRDLRGDVVVVNFWASWCKPCKKELRYLDDWNRALKEEPAHILAVSIDRDRKNAERFLKKSGLDVPAFHDGPDGLAKTLDLPSLPCTVVLDQWGHVVEVLGGGSEETVREIQRTVSKLLERAPQIRNQENAG